MKRSNNPDRKQKRQDEAKARQVVFDALPDEEKAKRREAKTKRKEQ